MVKQQNSLNLENFEKRSLVEEVENSFMEYAMSVIVARALPDVRDGLKPVHRRIFWSMHENNITPDRSFVKCARVVGEVMGKYHPHGDQSIYDALARMGQDFSLREVLIDGHGNFGSPSDPPAAMRYTECRLSVLASNLLKDIDEDTVYFVPNFDGGEIEPVVLPAKFPQLLLNGATGIAVGMATNIPSHNLKELSDGVQIFIEHKKNKTQDKDLVLNNILEKIEGPDFPTGGTIFLSDKKELYSTGRGSFKIRAKYFIEKNNIVVESIPPQTSIDAIAEKAADLVNSGVIIGVKDIRNESGQGKLRLVFECRSEANKEIIVNNLFKHTTMQSSFSVNMLALVDGIPKTLSLLEILDAWVSHQLEVIVRRSNFRLQKALDRLHIVDGLIKAVDVLDEVIAVIRQSGNRQEAKNKLISDPFSFSDIQAQHILDLTLGRLTKLGINDLRKEQKELQKLIKELQKLIKNEDAQLELIIVDMQNIVNEQNNLGNLLERKSEIVLEEAVSIDSAALVTVRNCVINLTVRGFIRNNYKKSEYKELSGDLIYKKADVLSTDSIVVFSNFGKAYKVRVSDVPDAKFLSLMSFFEFSTDEKIISVSLCTGTNETKSYIFITDNGQIKKLEREIVEKAAFRKDGFVVAKVDAGSEIISVCENKDEEQFIVITKNAKALRFNLSEVRPMGRSASGVRAIKLDSQDNVVSAICVNESDAIYAVTTTGYGLQRPVDSFPLQSRSGKGVKLLALKSSSGLVKFGGLVEDEEVHIAQDNEIIAFKPKAFPLRKEPTIGSKQLTFV